VTFPAKTGSDASEWGKEAPVRSILVAGAFALVAAAGITAQDSVYPIGNGVKSPILVKETKPGYTEGAMRRKVEGVVELQAVVLKNGTVREDVTVTRSLDAELDEEAIKAARLWEFKPGTKDGEAVNVQVNIEMSFSLRKK
jgi:protein TonB